MPAMLCSVQNYYQRNKNYTVSKITVGGRREEVERRKGIRQKI